MDSPIPPIPGEPPPVDLDNVDDNSVVDLRQPNPIPDAIDTMNVPEVVSEVVSDETSEAASPQVLGTDGEDSDTNTEM